MTERRKEFGKRGINPPPVVTHAPQGLRGGHEPHSERRMRTLAISVAAVGATAIGMLALTQGLQSLDRNVACPRAPDGSDANNSQCYYSHGSSGPHGGSGSGGGGYAGRSSASFGGFGGAGSAHGGGGGE